MHEEGDMPPPRFSNREEYLAWKAGQKSPSSTNPANGAVAFAAQPAPSAARKPKQGLKETFSGLPAWAWLFIVGCLAIPVVSLGGAIPAALGFGSAAGCASLAKKAEWATMPRVLACAAVTGGAWIIFIVFIAAFVSLTK
jgi:hypothetical protein